MTQLARLNNHIRTFGQPQALAIAAAGGAAGSSSAPAAPPSASAAASFVSASAISVSQTTAAVSAPASAASGEAGPEPANLQPMRELFALTKTEWFKHMRDSGKYDEPWPCSGTQDWLLCWWLDLDFRAITSLVSGAKTSVGPNFTLPVTDELDYFILSNGEHSVTIIHQDGLWSLLHSWDRVFHLFPALNVGNVDFNLYGVDYEQIRSRMTTRLPLPVRALAKPAALMTESKAAPADEQSDSNHELLTGSTYMAYTQWQYKRIAFHFRPDWLSSYDPTNHWKIVPV